MESKEKSGNLAIIGFMGAGKSTVGEVLSSKLGMDFIDLDELIEARAGKTIQEIFEVEGEEGFRLRESEALRDVLGYEKKVISCGGGVVLRNDNVKLLRSRCRVFLLEVSEEQAIERLAECDERPLLEAEGRADRIEELMRERAERYREAAHVVVETGERRPAEIAEEMAGLWKRSR